MSAELGKTRVCPLTNQMFNIVLPDVTAEKQLDERSHTPSRVRPKGRLRKPSHSVLKSAQVPISNLGSDPSVDYRFPDEQNLLTCKLSGTRRRTLLRSYSACGHRIHKGIPSLRRSPSPIDFSHCCLTSSGLAVERPKARVQTARRLRLQTGKKPAGHEWKQSASEELGINSPPDMGKLVHIKFVKQAQLVGLFKYHSNTRRFRSNLYN